MQGVQGIRWFEIEVIGMESHAGTTPMERRRDALVGVSHMITDLYPDGKNFIGEAKIMDTPLGKFVKSLMDEGAKLGVSSRGLGSLQQKNGASYVKDDFYLATAADIVADPSAPNAFVEGIMEGKEWIWDNGILQEAEIAQHKLEIEKGIRSRNANIKALEFAKFLKKL